MVSFKLLLDGAGRPSSLEFSRDVIDSNRIYFCLEQSEDDASMHESSITENGFIDKNDFFQLADLLKQQFGEEKNG